MSTEQELSWEEIAQNIEAHKQYLATHRKGLKSIISVSYLDEITQVNEALQQGQRIVLQVASRWSTAAPDGGLYNDPCTLVLKKIVVFPPDFELVPGSVGYRLDCVFWNETYQENCEDSVIPTFKRWQEILQQVRREPLVS